jgi:alkylation response protein AidB-like acyl-CoA dehydrogenase
MSADEAEALRARVRAFVAGAVIPFEPDAVANGVTDDLRTKLQELARAAGVFALQAPLDFGGGGADFRTTALLGTLGLAQQLIADNEIEIAACRALLLETAALVARGTKSTEESSRAKVFISEATSRIVDRSVQLAGGIGVTEDAVIGRIYADIRAFRIYDGPSEAHRAAIARRALARVKPRE